MKYATAEAFRRSLETRILNQGRDGGNVQIVRLRKMVTFDRFLARLLHASPDAWVIKGGMALDLRFGEHARSTKDLDLAFHEHRRDVAEVMMGAARLDLDDYFDFGARPVSDLDAIDQADVQRFRVLGLLAGRKFEEVTIDVGMYDGPAVNIERVFGSDLLAFAEIPRLTIPLVSIETHLAEKLHAYVQTYRSGVNNTRVKDLVDMVLIHDYQRLNAGRLATAIETVFSGRSTHQIPTGLPVPPPAWAAIYAGLALSVDLDPDVTQGYRRAQELLDPILAGSIREGARWEPAQRAWFTD